MSEEKFATYIPGFYNKATRTYTSYVPLCLCASDPSGGINFSRVDNCAIVPSYFPLPNELIVDSRITSKECTYIITNHDDQHTWEKCNFVMTEEQASMEEEEIECNLEFIEKNIVETAKELEKLDHLNNASKNSGALEILETLELQIQSDKKYHIFNGVRYLS